VRSYPRSRATGETVREVVASLLIEEVADPRVEFVTVTGVEMSPDLRHANIFITTHGDASRYAEALAGLDSAKGRIRTLVGQAIRLKYVPELHFRIDPSVDEAMKIASVIEGEYEAGRAPVEWAEVAETGAESTSTAQDEAASDAEHDGPVFAEGSDV
jgi:ribosome-binding factor A